MKVKNRESIALMTWEPDLCFTLFSSKSEVEMISRLTSDRRGIIKPLMQTQDCKNSSLPMTSFRVLWLLLLPSAIQTDFQHFIAHPHLLRSLLSATMMLLIFLVNQFYSVLILLACSQYSPLVKHAVNY